MEETESDVMEIFSQNGVVLKSAPAAYMSYLYLNTQGTLFITEYLNSNKRRCIEWKANDVTIDPDTQEQEWAVVNTVERRTRTLSDNYPPDPSMKSRLKIDLSEVKSFRVSRNNLKLKDGSGECLVTFAFQNCNCDGLVGVLKGLLRIAPTKRDKHEFMVMEERPETKQLDRSFAELNLFQEEPHSHIWKFIKNFHESPYETGMEAFAKVTDIVLRSPERREISDDVKELLNRSLTELDNATTTSQDEYEVVNRINKLPERKDFPRGRPLSPEQWRCLLDHEGKIEDIESLKLVIFRGGITPTLRRDLWKYLLNYYPFESSITDRLALEKVKQQEYYSMKLQWKTMTKTQEDHFADYRERKSLIEKDVNRTDRNMPFYAGENNKNLEVLHDILMTYVMYNFDLGYVQGMSDLLSPIYCLLRNEVDSFWCFVGFMNKVISNFDLDQAGMKEQLRNLHSLLAFVEPELANYLDSHDSGNMFFCFRWLLVWFKRELDEENVMRLWEVLWTGLPCKNFHLLFCVAVLQSEKEALMDREYGFTEILKHINDLSGNIDVSLMLNRAEGIYNQIKEAEHLTDPIRLILGLPIVVNNGSTDNNSPYDSCANSVSDKNSSAEAAVTFGPDNEVSYERAISNTYL